MLVNTSKVILLILLLGILVFAFAPGNWTPAWIVNHDKFSHMLAFFSLTVILNFSFPQIPLKFQVLILAIFAVMIEILQYALFNRGFSYLDIVFDSLGILIFVFLMLSRVLLLRKNN